MLRHARHSTCPTSDLTTSTAAEWLEQFRRQAGFYFFDYTSHKTEYDALFAKVRFWKLIVLGRSGHLGHVEEPRVLARALEAFIP